ncbi:solute carrier organic anion transporter family member 1C1-like [Ostrinia nubilalis]|uniref:solute carrier organic anion transporter family member 1C1-like n=1 Tax=Ostrinia nubilalis TaxID=29057 RepID=UPI0030823BA0
MKVFGYLLFLALAALATMTAAYEDEDPEEAACKLDCFSRLPHEPVCGTGDATFYNECVMKCEKATLIHAGACKLEDLMNNHGISN